MTGHITIKDLPESERPYEKFLKYGTAALSDAELLSIILKTGTKELSAIDIAQSILQNGHGNLLNLYDLSYDELIRIEGIGKVKAIQLKAIAELSKRISKTKSGYNMKLDNPATVAAYYMEQLRHNKNEIFICVYFDTKNHFLGDKTIALGKRNCVYIEDKDIFKAAYEKSAMKILILHNHPSGDCQPSNSDIELTDSLREKAMFLGFDLVDHIIIGDSQYFSFLEHNIRRGRNSNE